MADIADVEAALVGLVTLALYPNGMVAPSSVDASCRIYRGWPTPAGLDADLKAGTANVSIFPDGAPGRIMTRYPAEWHGRPAEPTLIASVAGAGVTFAGSADPGQVAGILVLGRTFAYRTVAGDTPASVAANLATLIRARQIVLLAGSTLTIPGASNIIARVVADAPALREVRRQSHDIRISCWCPTPAMRDSVAGAVDGALATVNFIRLPDTSFGRIEYKNTAVFDQSQSAILYRRDLIYLVEYPTIATSSQSSMIFGDLVLNGTDVSV